MHAPSPKAEPQLLLKFEPFKFLSEPELEVVASRSAVLHGTPKTRLFDAGSTDDYAYCLLDGSIDLVARDGARIRVDSGSEQATKPISQLKPRRYTAVAISPIAYLRIDTTGFGDFADGIRRSLVTVHEYDDELMMHAAGELRQEHQDLLDNQLKLPSLPAVAFRVKELVDREEIGFADVARVVNTDPSIAAKLIKAANSPLYHGITAVQTSEAAIARLGTTTTRQLVLSIALRDLFRSSAAGLQQRMQALWEHSIDIAALARVICRRLRLFDPERALLAGLTHDIGAVPIISYADAKPELLENAALLDATIQRDKARFGAMIMERWRFADEFVQMALHSEDWGRAHDGPDLADLIIVAHLHAVLLKPKMAGMPPLTQVPAFLRLTGDKIEPQWSLGVVKEAAAEVRELRSMFGW